MIFYVSEEKMNLLWFMAGVIAATLFWKIVVRTGMKEYVKKQRFRFDNVDYKIIRMDKWALK